VSESSRLSAENIIAGVRNETLDDGTRRRPGPGQTLFYEAQWHEQSMERTGCLSGFKVRGAWMRSIPGGKAFRRKGGKRTCGKNERVVGH